MSVEGYRPERIPTRRIEGSEISTFREITIDETDPVDLFDISWPKHNAGIKFKKVGVYYKKRYGVEEAYPLYEAIAFFKDSKNKVHKINLTRTTSRKRCLFTGEAANVTATSWSPKRSIFPTVSAFSSRLFVSTITQPY